MSTRTEQSRIARAYRVQYFKESKFSFTQQPAYLASVTYKS
jgi:hypothetical protein